MSITKRAYVNMYVDIYLLIFSFRKLETAKEVLDEANI